MAKVTYKMTGLRELETTLRQIPKAMGRRAGLNALRQGGEPIAKMARAIAPVDEGNLRESIDVSTRLARSQAGDKGALAPVEMYVGPGQHPQAITQEFGTFRSEEHTSELQSLMRIPYAVYCLKKKKHSKTIYNIN